MKLIDLAIYLINYLIKYLIYSDFSISLEKKGI